MLTPEENELLCRTGAGTPMGELFRRFWLPALLPSELPHPDSDPVRFRLLGEDLVAFRDTNGKVGFLAENCPHRGASLFFGRNEECGLRCVYHGWKFDLDGHCVDMPNEPAESSFKHKIRATAYPAEERGGFVWVYMGPSDKRPPFPSYQWLTQPNADQYVASKWVQESNYAQGLEGNIDSAHVGILHRTLDHPVFKSGRLQSAQDITVAKETDFGFVYGARRPMPDGTYYWRVTTYAMPTFTQIASQSRAGGGLFVLPMDDEHSWWFTINPPIRRESDGPAGERDAAFVGLLSGTSIADPATLGLIPGTFRRVRNKDNDYLIDRQMQRTFNYTGLPGNRAQDQAVTESMGPICDRSTEHLGTTDTAIILMRRYLMRLARELQKGQEPPMLAHPDRFRAVPMAVNTPEGNFQALWDAHYDAFVAESKPTLG
ncbi:MAG: Rieske 2Fe-2S domain-containing protein [Chloroflexota bacterium]|nr:Rieske 2Fe-2S domain-containing protein [Chloroflexota bacterium]